MAPKAEAKDSVAIRSGYAKLAGTVTAVVANSITVNADSASWTVNANANIVARGGGKIDISKIKVGDRVWVVGRVTASTGSPQGATIEAALIKDFSVTAKRVSLRGIISDLNAELRSFTLTTKKGAEVKMAVNTDADITVKSSTSTATSSFASLANGMKVKVKGLFQKSTSGTSTVSLVAATDVKAWTSATTTATSSIRSDWKERWEDWKERWADNHDDGRNDNDRDNEAHRKILERVDARINGSLRIGN